MTPAAEFASVAFLKLLPRHAATVGMTVGAEVGCGIQDRKKS